MKPALLISIMFFVCKIACAQYPDYVINANGDTLHCIITHPLFSGNGKYQTVKMKKAEKLNPDNIQEYAITGKNSPFRAVVKLGNHFKEFMPVIENGKIKLYEQTTTYNNMNGGRITGTSSTTYWYVSKGSDTIRPVKTTSISFSKKHREDYLASLFKDNKTVYDKFIADDKFSFDQIRNLVHIYNTGEPY